MAIQSVNKEYNTFARGIITEANPLNFPENASIDEANYVLNRDGSRQVRLGMDFEDNFTAIAVPSMTSAAIGVSSHEWTNAGNTIANQFVVVQVGDKLLVYNAAVDAISSSLLATIDASSVITDTSKEIQSSSGMGFFFFTSGTGNPAVLEYVGGVVSLRTVALKIRDFFGVYDGLAVSDKPASLTNAHKYNLYNQGWDATRNAAVFSNRGSYPSNAEIWYVAKNSTDDFAAGKLDKIEFGTSSAPRGRYIIDAFTRSASRTSLSGVSVVTDTETSRPACVGFFQQRVWYSGVDGKEVSATDTAPSMQGFVFYSRIIRTPQDFGTCHSEADPTAEIDNEVSPADGGYINIPDSGKIYKLVPLNDVMYIFAQNGVWAIRGGDAGFNATEQQVEKITDFGVVSGSSIVKTESSIMYWTKAGIYYIGPSEAGTLSAKNLSQDTIQGLFTSLRKASKEFATGNYYPVNRKVTWLYSTDPTFDGVTRKYEYDTELVFDVVLGAFTKNTITAIDGDTTPYVAGYINTPDLIDVSELGSSITKYLVVYYEAGSSIPYITFAHYRDVDFVDWKSFNGVGRYYEAYLLTGHELVGTTMVNKQAPYIMCHFKRTESLIEAVGIDGAVEYDDPSSCNLQSRWDFADSATSGKWGAIQEVYTLNRPFILPVAGQPLDYGHEVITTKRRLTGRGKALSLRFSSNNGKNCHILGWGLRYTGNNVV